MDSNEPALLSLSATASEERICSAVRKWAPEQRGRFAPGLVALVRPPDPLPAASAEPTQAFPAALRDGDVPWSAREIPPRTSRARTPFGPATLEPNGTYPWSCRRIPRRPRLRSRPTCGRCWTDAGARRRRPMPTSFFASSMRCRPGGSSRKSSAFDARSGPFLSKSWRRTRDSIDLPHRIRGPHHSRVPVSAPFVGPSRVPRWVGGASAEPASLGSGRAGRSPLLGLLVGDASGPPVSRRRLSRRLRGIRHPDPVLAFRSPPTGFQPPRQGRPPLGSSAQR